MTLPTNPRRSTPNRKLGRLSHRTRVLLLDAVGTVLHPGQPVAQTYLEVARDLGLKADLAALQAAFRPAFQQHFLAWQDRLPRPWRRRPQQWFRDWKSVETWLRRGATRHALQQFFRLDVDETAEQADWRNLVQQVLGQQDPAATQPQLKEAFGQLWQAFARPNAWVVAAAATRLLSQARHRGLTVCLASNFDRRLIGVADGLSPQLPIDRVFVSSQLACRKPDPRFYQRILSALDVPPQQVVMVGDRWWEDYAVPSSLGIASFLLSPQSRASSTNSASSTEPNSPLADQRHPRKIGCLSQLLEC